MNQKLPQFIHYVVEHLQSVRGIAAIALGGSRARGNHTQKSDVDLGIYYKPENPLDLVALNYLAAELDGCTRGCCLCSRLLFPQRGLYESGIICTQ